MTIEQGFPTLAEALAMASQLRRRNYTARIEVRFGVWTVVAEQTLAAPPDQRRNEAMAYFRTDNTEGYDEADLAALNAAWESLGVSVLDEDDAIDTKTMLDHIAARLLAEYDAGKRGDALVAFYYAG